MLLGLDLHKCIPAGIRAETMTVTLLQLNELLVQDGARLALHIVDDPAAEGGKSRPIHHTGIEQVAITDHRLP